MANSRRDTGWAPSPGDVIDGRYRLDEVVDSGGAGVIMRAEHVRMRRPVAVKFLHPEIAVKSGYRDRFEREVDLAAAIDHPNIVQCYDFGETEEGVLYLVMEFLNGESLKDTLRRAGRFDTERCVDVGLQLLDGLAAAHMAEIVHRDLKPGNVFVAEDHRGRDVVKILDFGLAKSLSSDDVRLTKTGAICGTASYVPPETLVLQQSGKPGDVYAVGLILLESLLGRKVFGSRFMAQTFVQHLVVPPRIPRRVWDSQLGEILRRALRKHPDRRPQDAEEMYQLLDGIKDHVPKFLLRSDELPPPPSEDLPDDILEDLAEGKYDSLETLRTLPAPKPWDADSKKPDDSTTQQHVVAALARGAAELDDTQPTFLGEEKLDILETKPSIDSELSDELPPSLDEISSADDTTPDPRLDQQKTKKFNARRGSQVGITPEPTRQPPATKRSETTSPPLYAWALLVGAVALASVGAWALFVSTSDTPGESRPRTNAVTTSPTKLDRPPTAARESGDEDGPGDDTARDDGAIDDSADSVQKPATGSTRDTKPHEPNDSAATSSGRTDGRPEKSRATTSRETRRIEREVRTNRRSDAETSKRGATQKSNDKLGVDSPDLPPTEASKTRATEQSDEEPDVDSSGLPAVRRGSEQTADEKRERNKRLERIMHEQLKALD